MFNGALKRHDAFETHLYFNEEASCREASFVDCGAEFTKTTPAVSIAIVPP